MADVKITWLGHSAFLFEAEKKLLTILGVYENDRLQIIFFMVYMSLTNSYVASEIVLKKSFRDF